MKRILGFGSAAVDFRITTADLGEGYKDKLLAKEVAAIGGGACANCMVQIARLGGKAYWLGKLGVDWVAEKILSDLKNEGVNCNYALQDNNYSSPFNLAVYAGESKRRVGGFLLANSLNELKAQEIKKLASNINSDDIVYIEIGEIKLDICLDLCREVKQREAMLIVDVDLDPEKQCIGNIDCFHDIMKLSDVIVPNLCAMSSFIDESKPQETAMLLAEKYSAIVIVTAGSDGAYYSEDGITVIHQEAFDTICIDSVGAGDAFHGGLVFGFAKDLNIKDSVELAAKCGAYACKEFGARSSMPRVGDFC